MQRFGNTNKATSLTKQDWAILATTAGFKFLRSGVLYDWPHHHVKEDGVRS